MKNVLILVGLFLSPTFALAATPRECLTNVIYQEARSEPFSGQLAVGYTVWNRAHSGRYPLDLCAVTGARKQYHTRESASDRLAWSRAEHVARMVMFQAEEDPTGGATHFLKCGRKTTWTRVFQLTLRAGSHCFYKEVRKASRME